MNVKSLRCFMTVWAGLLTLGLMLLSGPAYAGTFTLENWNEANLDASDDYVQVTTGSDCLGGNTICVRWFEGAVVEGPTVNGIDMFFYDSTETVTNPDGWTPPPSSAGFEYTGTFTGDSFGSFETRGTDPGGTLGISSAIVFTLTGLTDLDSALDFAVHVRYDNDCSGFVSGRQSSDDPLQSDANCARVPEPSSLALLGLGLIGVAVSGRRWIAKT